MNRPTLALCIVAALVILGAGGAALVSRMADTVTVEELELTPEGMILEEAEVVPEITADATVVPGEYVELSFPEGVSGKIKTVMVKEGVSVAVGAPLLTLDAHEAAQTVDQARDKLRSMEQRRAQAEKSESATLAERKLAARLEVAQAQGKVNKLKAKPTNTELAVSEQAVKDAEVKLEALRVSGTSSSGELAAAESTLTVARATLTDARKGADPDELKVAELELEKTERSLKTLTDGIVLGQEGGSSLESLDAEIAAARTEVKRAEAELGKFELRAPQAGTVMFVGTKAGESVKAGTVLVRIANTSQWKLKTSNVTEADVYKLTPGQTASFTLDAIEDESFTATVESVQRFGQLDRGELTYPVTLTIDTSDDRLRWGMLASVSFTIE
ncbi:efflux RND transporter periplasmic adaptor subunit [Candidatus Berkelbacteria bacterium]|nr:efflux RND transporter periplasmic adaptor subunit [Candidatus Berkelbacteria bacterium]